MAGEPAATGLPGRDADDGHPDGDGCCGRTGRWCVRVCRVAVHCAPSARGRAWYAATRGDADGSADRDHAYRRAHGEPDLGQPNGAGVYSRAHDTAKPGGHAARHRRAIAGADPVGESTTHSQSSCNGVACHTANGVADVLADALHQSAGSANPGDHAGANGRTDPDGIAQPKRHGQPVGDAIAHPRRIGHPEAAAHAAPDGVADRHANAFRGGGVPNIALTRGRAGRALRFGNDSGTKSGRRHRRGTATGRWIRRVPGTRREANHIL